MAQKDRLEQIRQIVRLEKKVVVANLSNQFGVTPETIRRDLEKLEEEGLVVRTYGGAVLNQTESSEKIDFVKRSETNVEEKRAIAGIVSEMVPPNASIGCDASSTVMETLKYLSEREDILVLTNSVKVIREMERSRFGILSTGGRVNRQSYSCLLYTSERRRVGLKNNECCEVVIVGAAHTDLQLYPVGADVLDTASYSVKQMVLTVGGDALNEATVITRLGHKVRLVSCCLLYTSRCV